jgi:hypothetical protein
VTSTVAAANVRLAISISNSRATSKRDNKFALRLTDQPFIRWMRTARPNSSPTQHDQKNQHDDH